MGCFHKHFQVKPSVTTTEGEGLLHSKNKGTHDHDYFIQIDVVNKAKLNSSLTMKITIDTSPPHEGTVHDGKYSHPEIDFQSDRELFAHWEGFFDKESGVQFYQYGFASTCLNADNFDPDISNTKNITQTTVTHTRWTAPTTGKYFITVIAYNRALDPSKPVCSDGVTIDTTGPTISQVYLEGARIEGGLVSHDGQIYYITNNRNIHHVTNPTPGCYSNATPAEDISLFPVEKFPNETMKISNICSEQPIPPVFLFQSYLSKHAHIYVNWTGTDKQSGIFDYEFGLSSDKSSSSAPDLMPFISTNHHPWYKGYHSQLNDGSEFYICIKATNKAGISLIQTLGPVIVHTSKPIFKGEVNVNLDGRLLNAEWLPESFTDIEHAKLVYTAAVGIKPNGQEVLPFSPLSSGGSCQLSHPPSCTIFTLDELEWNVHHQYIYYVTVRVVNIVGLYTVAISKPYIHTSRLPSEGVVFEVVLPEEETEFKISKLEDSDFQMSTSKLTARWFGFESDDLLQDIKYKVGVRSETTGLASVNVGSKTEHTFLSLNLQLHQKYVVMVTATTDAGSKTVLSDGLVIVSNNLDVRNELKVNDGPRCSTKQGTKNWKPVHYSTQKLNQSCSDDVDYQSSTSTYMVNWKISSTFQHIYPDVKWNLQVKQDHTDIWTDITGQNLITNSGVLTKTMALERCKAYRSKMRLCIGDICSQPIYSDGVTVLTAMELLEMRIHMISANMFDIVLSFKSTEESDVCSSRYIIYRYEWSLTDNKDTDHLFTTWKRVEDVQEFDQNKFQFRITLADDVDFSECRTLAVRIFNKAGLSTIISSEIIDCSAIDPVLIIPATVIDVLGEPVNQNINANQRGKNIILEQNSLWTEPDVDYTPYENVISAVWPTLRHRNYTWGLIEDQSFSTITHFTRQTIIITDPCSHPSVIICGTTETEYVNILPTTPLSHGRRYHVCIHADSKNITHEKWTEELPEINSCSDGVTVDLSPPAGGRVWVETDGAGIYQISTNYVNVFWDSFVDVEEQGLSVHPSGISQYYIQIGSSKGGSNIFKSQHVGAVNHKVMHNITLKNGHSYYVTLQAVDFVNRSTTVISEGFIVDNTPPLVTSTPIQFPKPYLTSNTIISLCWAESFRDLESGIYSYRWSIGSRPGHQDIIGYVKTSDDCDEVTMDTKLHDGYTYYVTVQAMNGAGLRSSLVSRPLIVDTSPPIAGHVYDIIQDRPGDDIDYISTQEEPSVRWIGFHDPHSSIKLYKVRLGTCVGCDDVMQEYEAGTHQNFTFKHINTFPGTRYFTMVTGCNMADMCTSVSSDGFIIDITPPISGSILDGTRDLDIDFQSLRNYIGAKWNGFKDSESGIARYEWRVGTSKGGDELFKSEDLPVVELTYKSNIPDDNILPVGIKIYITIRAYNKAGLYSEATSNGFIVDITSPLILKKPVLSSTYYSIKPSTSISRCSIKVEWTFTDDESDIERQYVSLSPHLMGDFNSSVLEIPSVLDEYIFTNLELHDGSKYRVKLIGCNLAGLCRSATTEDILVDSSPPSRGTFAIDTYHAANLVRYPGKWIEWNTTSITVAWIGFADLHTGITHYMVSIGTKPFFTNINKEGFPVKVNHEDGVKHNDEGVIQIATIETGRELQHATSVFIAIWAFNEVGLRSEPIHSEFQLVRVDYQTDDGGSLVRRCQAYSCEGHCVCGEQDKTCSLPSGCIDISQGNNNTFIEVKDVTDLMSSEAIQANYTFSNMLLSARWNIITINGLQPIRYEVSCGEADNNEPSGIFDASEERFWFDIGQNVESTFTFTKEKRLYENMAYSVFVRAWYDDKTYAVFKSPGITVITLAPRLTNIAGAAIKEIKSARDIKDIDFQTSSTDIIIYWKNKFIGGIRGLNHAKPYISTHPLGHNIHQGVDIPVSDVFYTATGLSLEQGRIYYSTVLVYNKAGLSTWASSDGIIIDTTPPSSGIVHDGYGIYDKDYQSSVYLLSSSWYGFSDKDSGIVKYYWCVGTNDDNTTCDVQIWKDVGINLKVNYSLAVLLSSGQNIYHKVYAEDGSGLTSSVSISNGVIIDASPPEPVDLEYIHDNIILNPSYEQMPTSETNEACDNILPLNWNADSTSCIKSVKSQPTVSKDGENYIKVKGHIRQRITNIKLDTQYQAVIHVGYPHDVAVHHHMVEGFVRLGTEIYTFNLDPDLCQDMCNVDDQPIVYWYKLTYIYRPARRTEYLIIGTTRDNMILAVDDVQLREINYLPMNRGVNHIIHHALFKPTWSSLHLNWHFRDEESPIIHYQWALGTVKDGTQIKRFTSTGRQNHVTLTNLQLAHNTQLYLTVKATNGAGLSTVSRSESIIVDMTPPVITHINDGLGSDVKFQLTSLVSVNWKTEDAESGIDYCEWAIGTSMGQTDIQIFSPVSRNKTSVSAELKDGIKDNNIKIYCTVRCYNNVGLHVTATTNGVEIINQMNHDFNEQLIRYKDGISQYQVDNQCHPIPDSMRLKWNTESSIDTKAVLIMLTTNDSSIDKEINLDVCYNSAKLTGLKLQPDSMYNISVSTINVLGRLDTRLSQIISSIIEPPTIIAESRAQLTKSLDGKTIIITWKGVFMSQWKDIYFEVSLGTTPSEADVIQWQETKADTITANLANGKKFKKLYLTVTAIDPCGLFTTFNAVINI